MRRLCVVDVEAERQQNTLIYHSEGRLVSWIEVRETPPGIRTRRPAQRVALMELIRKDRAIHQQNLDICLIDYG